MDGFQQSEVRFREFSCRKYACLQLIQMGKPFWQPRNHFFHNFYVDANPKTRRNFFRKLLEKDFPLYFFYVDGNCKTCCKKAKKDPASSKLRKSSLRIVHILLSIFDIHGKKPNMIFIMLRISSSEHILHYLVLQQLV